MYHVHFQMYACVGRLLCMGSDEYLIVGLCVLKGPLVCMSISASLSLLMCSIDSLPYMCLVCGIRVGWQSESPCLVAAFVIFEIRLKEHVLL